MLCCTFKKIDNILLNHRILTDEPKPIDKHLKEIFVRHFNEHDYKKYIVDTFKKKCEEKNIRLITDYNFDENNIVKLRNKPKDATEESLNSVNEITLAFVIFDTKKFYNIIESLQSLGVYDKDYITKHAVFYLIIDFDDFFEVLYKIRPLVYQISFTKYELFNKKIMLLSKINMLNYKLNSEIIASLSMYNYIFNKSYELLGKLSKKYQDSKIFEIIDAEETEEAKNLKTLLSTFNNYDN